MFAGLKDLAVVSAASGLPACSLPGAGDTALGSRHTVRGPSR